ncbi:MAG: hypothetical protein O2960_03690 [Verrucomicrobia bacterium]|nr:hypothetical protein [Verrucomicrobiota bacterium]
MKPSKQTTNKVAKKTPVAKTAPAASKATPERNEKVETKTALVENSNGKQAEKAKVSNGVNVDAPQKKTSKQPVTMVAVKADVGFGNALFIRGQGLGLTWDRGLPLNCVDSSTWIWSAQNVNGKAEFKLLINDQIWSKGENLRVTPGEKIEIAPAF